MDEYVNTGAYRDIEYPSLMRLRILSQLEVPPACHYRGVHPVLPYAGLSLSPTQMMFISGNVGEPIPNPAQFLPRASAYSPHSRLYNLRPRTSVLHP